MANSVIFNYSVPLKIEMQFYLTAVVILKILKMMSPIITSINSLDFEI